MTVTSSKFEVTVAMETNRKGYKLKRLKGGSITPGLTVICYAACWGFQMLGCEEEMNGQRGR